MLSGFWQQVTLSRVKFHHWREVSLLHQMLEPLRRWRAGSWLLAAWGDWIGLALVLVLFALAPFVSTALIGVLLLACGAFWVLMSVADEAGEGFTPIHALVIVFWGVMAIASRIFLNFFDYAFIFIGYICI